VRSVVALGGKERLRRGEAITSVNQCENMQVACGSTREAGVPVLMESLIDIEEMLDGAAGTFVLRDVESIVYRDRVERGYT